MEELDLKEICNIFYKRKVGMIIILMLTIAIGCIYSFFIVKPEYTSYTTLLMVPVDIGELKETDDETITKTVFMLNSKLVETYSELIRKKDILKEMIDEFELKDIRIENFKEKIEVTAETDGGLIRIEVTNSNAEIAAKIANRLAKVFEEKVADTYIQNNVSIVDYAEISEEPSNIDHVKNIIAFAFIGIVIAFGYALVKYMWNSSSKK